ncbi:helix-turn-helix domain-containing protein [Levilactobacillus mulengensis]|uniref:helix-turn-helix domain-containing protein n=1 Tax=Levilactobacillus mulengensis TaxID=2486025 RepID=UPI000F7B3128|nr:helix-turn-helix transcriptional regulator [Levilactobacillus mulengensis]
MNIGIFVARRKALKISQVKLCTGICTQATLSKFENNNRVPSLSILSKLCVRLGLTVDDLYQESAETAVQLRHDLDNIEKELMMENYQCVLKRLAKFKPNQIDEINVKMQFCYLRGCVNALVNQQPDKILFDFAQILNDLDERHQTIFTQLAFLGSGIMYARHQETQQADFYFDKVYQHIKAYHPDDHLDEPNQYYLRMLTLIFFTADFYAGQDKYRLSNQLIDTGVQLCSDERVTYYLPRLKFLATQNAVNQGKQPATIQRLMDETLAFTRINQNEVIEVKLAALKCQFNRQLAENK